MLGRQPQRKIVGNKRLNQRRERKAHQRKLQDRRVADEPMGERVAPPEGKADP